MFSNNVPLPQGRTALFITEIETEKYLKSTDMQSASFKYVRVIECVLVLGKFPLTDQELRNSGMEAEHVRLIDDLSVWRLLKI